MNITESRYLVRHKAVEHNGEPPCIEIPSFGEIHLDTFGVHSNRGSKYVFATLDDDNAKLIDAYLKDSPEHESGIQFQATEEKRFYVLPGSLGLQEKDSHFIKFDVTEM